MITRVLGYLKINKNNLWCFFGLFILIEGGLFLIGCKSAKDTEKIDRSEFELKEFITKYEKTFNPADYDVDVSIIKEEEKKYSEAIEAAKLVTIIPPETVPGFRVQILFTPEIEHVNQARDTLSNILPDDWTYIVYDPPYYKLRIGNFIDRIAANQMLKKLVDIGYRDAWIVPDKIIKNLPPKPPDILIEPERKPE